VAGTVLLIEDEPSIGALVQAYLDRDGYHVVWSRSGEDGLAELPRHHVRIVILDLGLPGIDGFEVCTRIRAISDVPVIMLTARDEEVDRVAGLEVGADDYVSKPFSPRELVARVKAILRRVDKPPRSSAILTIEDVTVKPSQREVEVAGQEVELTAREFDLLEFLASNPGTVFSRDVLLDRVWGMGYPGGTRTVDVHVAQLRRKLARPDVIRTVRGAGYKAVRTAQL
jgi:DNA-binding response OmpR family regulator